MHERQGAGNWFAGMVAASAPVRRGQLDRMKTVQFPHQRLASLGNLSQLEGYRGGDHGRGQAVCDVSDW